MGKMNFERKRILIYAVTFLIWAIAFTFLALAIDLKAIIREYSISWGTLTLINSEIAQGKNKSGVTWFLLSIFLGPIATFLLVISSKDTDTTGSRNTI